MVLDGVDEKVVEVFLFILVHEFEILAAVFGKFETGAHQIVHVVVENLGHTKLGLLHSVLLVERGEEEDLLVEMGVKLVEFEQIGELVCGREASFLDSFKEVCVTEAEVVVPLDEALYEFDGAVVELVEVGGLLFGEGFGACAEVGRVEVAVLKGVDVAAELGFVVELGKDVDYVAA